MNECKPLRDGDKTVGCVERAKKEGLGDNLVGFQDMGRACQMPHIPSRVTGCPITQEPRAINACR